VTTVLGQYFDPGERRKMVTSGFYFQVHFHLGSFTIPVFLQFHFSNKAYFWRQVLENLTFSESQTLQLMLHSFNWNPHFHCTVARNAKALELSSKVALEFGSCWQWNNACIYKFFVSQDVYTPILFSNVCSTKARTRQYPGFTLWHI